jgi:hypothetical protein
MNHAKTSFSTEIFANAIISVVQYLGPLWYVPFPPLVQTYMSSQHPNFVRSKPAWMHASTGSGSSAMLELFQILTIIGIAA